MAALALVASHARQAALDMVALAILAVPAVLPGRSDMLRSERVVDRLGRMVAPLTAREPAI